VATLLKEGYTSQEIEEALVETFADDQTLGHDNQSYPFSSAHRLAGNESTTNDQSSRGLAAGSADASPPDHAEEGGTGGSRSGSGSPMAFSDYVPLSGSKYATRRRGGESGGSMSGEEKPSSPVIFTDFINVAGGEVELGVSEWDDVPIVPALVQNRDEARVFLEAWFARGAADKVRLQSAHPPLSADDNPITWPLSLPPAVLPEAVRTGIFAAEKTLSSHKATIAAAPREVYNHYSRRPPSDIW
jgi:hypothetical protein